MSLDVYFSADIGRVLRGLALTADATITDERERRGYFLALSSMAVALGIDRLPATHRQTIRADGSNVGCGLGAAANGGALLLEKTNGR